MVNCIFACGEMRSFTAPLIWRDRAEAVEIILNAKGRVCDNCGAVAFDIEDARRIHNLVTRMVL